MKNVFKFIILLGVVIVMSGTVNAQMGMMGSQDQYQGVSKEIYDHTVGEEAEGKEVWHKIQSGQVTCANLTEDNFDVLGEYFMGQMMGTSHAAMNAMMMQVHGEEGEAQIHVVMGKRLSGCDTSASFGDGGFGWMPMMQMMWGGWQSPDGQLSNGMMRGYGGYSVGGFGFLGIIIQIFVLIILVLVVIALWKWIKKQGSSGTV